MNHLSTRASLPPDISEHGYQIDRLINFLHYFMFFLFVVWGIFIVYCLIRFRQRPGHSATHAPVKSFLPKFGELLVVVVEVILLVGFTMPVWADLKDHSLFPKKGEGLEVRVVAQQYAWNFHYPGPDGIFGPTQIELVDETENPVGLDRSHPDAKDDITTINQLHAPVGKTVHIRLSSKDVIHSFSIPMLRIKQDVIPGMEISIYFKATKTSDEVRTILQRTVPVPPESEDEHFIKLLSKQVLMKDYGAGAARGDWIDDVSLPALRQAGIAEIDVGPASPVEIHCTQLCGLNHFSMRGFFTVETEEEFGKWMEQQALFIVDDDDDWGDEDEEEEEEEEEEEDSKEEH